MDKRLTKPQALLQVASITFIRHSAKLTSYVLGLGAIALAMNADLPPNLAVLAGGIGVNIISEILDRVASGNISDDEIVRRLEELLRDEIAAQQLQLEAVQNSLASSIDQLGLMEAAINAGHEELVAIFELVSGKADALSSIPKGARRLDISLVGRDEEIAWLREHAKQDCLVVGEPGSGKTFLLYQHAQDKGGLFVVERNRDKLFRELTAKQPDMVIVDDVHSPDNQELLRELSDLRQAHNLRFSIIGTSWPRRHEKAKAILQLPASNIRRLPLLDRDQIVEVVKAAGIHGSERLIREIVDQSVGLPGLAEILSTLCLRSDITSVILGNVLTTELQTRFEPLVGRGAMIALALFAVGGDYGMDKDVVRDKLRISNVEFDDLLDTLAAGGVLGLAGQRNFKARPDTLRHALIRDVFLSQSISVFSFDDFMELARQAPSFADAVLGAIQATAFGSNLPLEVLYKLVEQAQSDNVWEAFAWLNKDAANITLDQHPELLNSISPACLYHMPERTIPMLLNQAKVVSEPIKNDKALHTLNAWATGQYNAATISRRKILLDSVLSYLAKPNSNTTLGLWGLRIAFDPGYEYGSLDPGRGSQFTIHFGLLKKDDLTSLVELWPSTFDAISTLTVTSWEPLFGLIHEWCYPHPRIVLDDIHQRIVDDFVIQLIKCAIVIGKEHPGVQHRLAELSRGLGTKPTFYLNDDFEILYPPRNLGEDWRLTVGKQKASVAQLAAQWMNMTPAKIVERLKFFSDEVRIGGVNDWPVWTPFLLDEIGRQTDKSSELLDALIAGGFPPTYIEPLVKRLKASGDNRWLEYAEICLRTPNLRYAISEIILTSKENDVPDALVKSVLDQLDDSFASIIETMGFRGELQERLLQKLLEHSNPRIQLATAIGMWQSAPNHEIPGRLRLQWETAVANAPLGTQGTLDYSLGEILVKNRTVAYQWLSNQIQTSRAEFWRHDTVFDLAIGALDHDDKKRLLQSIPDHYSFDDMVFSLVGNDVVLFEELFKTENLKRHQVAAIGGAINEHWNRKVQIALDYGIDPRDIASATLIRPETYFGNESEMWANRIHEFEQLLDHENPSIRFIAETCIERAKTRLARSREEERDADIYGRDW